MGLPISSRPRSPLISPKRFVLALIGLLAVMSTLDASVSGRCNLPRAGSQAISICTALFERSSVFSVHYLLYQVARFVIAWRLLRVPGTQASHSFLACPWVSGHITRRSTRDTNSSSHRTLNDGTLQLLATRLLPSRHRYLGAHKRMDRSINSRLFLSLAASSVVPGRLG